MIGRLTRLLHRSQGAPEVGKPCAQITAAMPADDALSIDKIRLGHTDRPEGSANRAGAIARNQHARAPGLCVATHVRVVRLVHTQREHANAAPSECAVKRIEDREFAAAGRAPRGEHRNHGGGLAGADANFGAVERADSL